jgi:hypothetical protein
VVSIAAYAVVWIGGCVDIRRSNGEQQVKPIQLDLATAAALGSIVVHVEEAIGGDGHPFDIEALKSLCVNPGVQAFLGVLRPLALIPEKRAMTMDKTLVEGGALRVQTRKKR